METYDVERAEGNLMTMKKTVIALLTVLLVAVAVTGAAA